MLCTFLDPIKNIFKALGLQIISLMAYLTNLIIPDASKRVIYKHVKVDAPVPVAARAKV